MTECFLACYGIHESGIMPACDGRLVRVHLIPKHLLRREFPKRWRRYAENPRTWVWGCGGVVGNAGHHGMLDQSRTLRIPRSSIPREVEEFAAELGLTWYLDREYGLLERCSA